MTSKSDFTAEEWQLILEAPPSAGMIVVTAQRGGSFRETIAMAKAYAEARQQHGKSELLDEIVAAKPERDHTHYHSFEELKQHGLQHLRDSVALLESKATPAEVEEYRRFIVTLSHKVAAAHREHGQEVSDAEQAAINDITEALNVDHRVRNRHRVSVSAPRHETTARTRCSTRTHSSQSAARASYPTRRNPNLVAPSTILLRFRRRLHVMTPVLNIHRAAVQRRVPCPNRKNPSQKQKSAA